MYASKPVFYKTFICLLLLTTGLSLIVSGQKKDGLDYLITNALVFDGTENAPVKTDIGIIENKIVFIGQHDKKTRAKKIIDASGLYLCPGFIDPHTHYDRYLNSNSASERANLAALAQGVTTVFIGSDGGGTYKITDAAEKYIHSGIGTNTGFFVGFGPVRYEVLGNENVSPDENQIHKMELLVERGMKEGAYGLSTGLYYSPQSFAATDEVIALARIANEYDGIYDTHMRSESNGLESAVQETINIGEAIGIPLMISHIKCLGPSAWGTSDVIIKMIENAHLKGIKMIASQYPYEASQTSLKAMLIPSWAQAGGNNKMVARLENPDTLKEVMKGLSRNLSIRGGDSKIVISSSNIPEFHKKPLHQIAMEMNLSPEETAVEILKKHPAVTGISFSMVDEDIVNFMQQPWVVTGSDGGAGHPRAFSSFIRKIKKYALDDQVITLQQAIHRSTGLTADFMGIQKRGYIRVGYFADMVLFDPIALKDNATYTEPDQAPSGVGFVFVNGKLAISEGSYTGILAGIPLLHTSD